VLATADASGCSFIALTKTTHVSTLVDVDRWVLASSNKAGVRDVFEREVQEGFMNGNLSVLRLTVTDAGLMVQKTENGVFGDAPFSELVHAPMHVAVGPDCKMTPWTMEGVFVEQATQDRLLIRETSDGDYEVELDAPRYRVGSQRKGNFARNGTSVTVDLLGRRITANALVEKRDGHVVSEVRVPIELQFEPGFVSFKEDDSAVRIFERSPR
jgi:hypothetical protein